MFLVYQCESVQIRGKKTSKQMPPYFAWEFIVRLRTT